MSTARLAIRISVVSITLLGGGLTAAQEFPSKPIRVMTSPPGGGSDYVARQVAQGISAPLGQQVIIENRPGGSFAGEAVSRAAPDGYTLIYYGSALWLLPLMRPSFG